MSFWSRHTSQRAFALMVTAAESALASVSLGRGAARQIAPQSWRRLTFRLAHLRMALTFATISCFPPSCSAHLDQPRSTNTHHTNRDQPIAGCRPTHRFE